MKIGFGTALSICTLGALGMMSIACGGSARPAASPNVAVAVSATTLTSATLPPSQLAPAAWDDEATTSATLDAFATTTCGEAPPVCANAEAPQCRAAAAAR